MNESELERLERIVASLAEQMAEQNKAYALRLEEDRAKREEEHAKQEKEHEKREAERAKREAERAKREEEREEERAEREKAREKNHAKLDAQLAELAEQHKAYAFQREKDYAKAEKERVEYRKQRIADQKRMDKLDELFTGQWGKLMEALIEGELVTLLNQRNIPVEGLASEHKRKDSNGEDYEIDLIAINGDTVVAVEVKTTLWLNEVRSFLEKLPRFTDAFREYRGRQIIGAVAYLKANEGSDRYASKQGLYVIRAVGNGAIIVNPVDFKPRIF